jgi:uncharacterized protein (UPF0276 family)
VLPGEVEEHGEVLLTTNVSDPLLELLLSNEAPIDGVEVGPWFSVRQICEYRQKLPQLPFTFHGGNLIERVGIIPGTVARTAAYVRCTGSPWVSMHITMWLPSMVWLMLRRGWRMPLPNPKRATQKFVQRVKKLARSIDVPVILENIEPLPFDGYDFEVQTERIAEVLDTLECGFLLDIGHARVSASRLDITVHEYLSGLPLDDVVQVHVSGPRKCDGRLIDAHEPLQEIDYELLNFVLSRAQPEIVTLEYVRQRDCLREQLYHLRGIVDSHSGIVSDWRNER